MSASLSAPLLKTFIFSPLPVENLDLKIVSDVFPVLHHLRQKNKIFKPEVTFKNLSCATSLWVGKRDFSNRKWRIPRTASLTVAKSDFGNAKNPYFLSDVIFGPEMKSSNRKWRISCRRSFHSKRKIFQPKIDVIPVWRRFIIHWRVHFELPADIL